MQDEHEYQDLSEKPCELFLGCPECGGHDGYLNYNRVQFARCDDHKTMWSPGSNLVSSWRDEDWEIWQDNAEFLGQYRKVEPRLFQSGSDEKNYRIKADSRVAIDKMTRSLGWQEVVELVLCGMPQLTPKDWNGFAEKVQHYAERQSQTDELPF
jgi:hypothetical protein